MYTRIHIYMYIHISHVTDNYICIYVYRYIHVCMYSRMYVYAHINIRMYKLCTCIEYMWPLWALGGMQGSEALAVAPLSRLGAFGIDFANNKPK